MKILIIAILLTIQILANTLFVYEIHKLLILNNALSKEADYYKALFKKVLEHKRALENFINLKINPHIYVEQ